MFFRRIALGLILSLLTTPVTAQDLSWKLTNFPYSNSQITDTLNRLSFYPNGSVMVYSKSTLIQSTNEGNTWTISNFGGLRDIYSIGGKKLLGGGGNGLISSEDGGNSWSVLRQGTARLFVSGSVYMVRITDFSGDYLAATWNGGTTWDTLPSSFHEIRWMEQIGSRTLVATTTSLRWTSDNGKEWTYIESQHDGILGSIYTPGGRILYGEYFTMRYDSASNSITESKARTQEGPIKRIVRLDDQTLVMLSASSDGLQIRVSGDNGKMWIPQGISVSSDARIFDIGSSSPSAFYVVDENGVYLSRDSLQTFSNIAQRLRGREVTQLLHTGNGTVYAATQYGELYRTVNRGDSWDSLYSTDDRVTVLGLSPEGSIFLGTSGKLRSSYDGGYTWHVSEVGLAGRSPMSFAVGPDRWLYLGTDSGLFISTNEGASWRMPVSKGMGVLRTDRRLPPVTAIAIDSSGYLYVGTNRGLVHSRDRGESYLDGWLQTIEILNVQVSNSRYVYVGSYGGGTFSDNKNFYVSRDLLTNDWVWPAYDVRFQSFNTLSLNSKEQVVGSVFLSPDAGWTWQNRSGNLSLSYANALAQVLDDQDHVYLSYKGKLYRSEQPALAVEPERPLIQSALAYPNPARKSIRIDVVEPGECQIFNALGREMRSIHVTPGVDLDVIDLPVGAYYGRIVSASGSLRTIQFLIQR